MTIIPHTDFPKKAYFFLASKSVSKTYLLSYQGDNTKDVLGADTETSYY